MSRPLSTAAFLVLISLFLSCASSLFVPGTYSGWILTRDVTCSDPPLCRAPNECCIDPYNVSVAINATKTSILITLPATNGTCGLSTPMTLEWSAMVSLPFTGGCYKATFKFSEALALSTSFVQLNSSGYIIGDYLQPYSVGQYECPLYIDEYLRCTNTTIAPILGYIGVPSAASPLASIPAIIPALALSLVALLAW